MDHGSKSAWRHDLPREISNAFWETLFAGLRKYWKSVVSVPLNSSSDGIICEHVEIDTKSILCHSVFSSCLTHRAFAWDVWAWSHAVTLNMLTNSWKIGRAVIVYVCFSILSYRRRPPLFDTGIIAVTLDADIPILGIRNLSPLGRALCGLVFQWNARKQSFWRLVLMAFPFIAVTLDTIMPILGIQNVSFDRRAINS